MRAYYNALIQYTNITRTSIFVFIDVPPEGIVGRNGSAYLDQEYSLGERFHTPDSNTSEEQDSLGMIERSSL